MKSLHSLQQRFNKKINFITFPYIYVNTILCVCCGILRHSTKSLSSEIPER